VVLPGQTGPSGPSDQVGEQVKVEKVENVFWKSLGQLTNLVHLRSLKSTCPRLVRVKGHSKICLVRLAIYYWFKKTEIECQTGMSRHPKTAKNAHNRFWLVEIRVWTQKGSLHQQERPLNPIIYYWYKTKNRVSSRSVRSDGFLTQSWGKSECGTWNKDFWKSLGQWPTCNICERPVQVQSRMS